MVSFYSKIHKPNWCKARTKIREVMWHTLHFLQLMYFFHKQLIDGFLHAVRRLQTLRLAPEGQQASANKRRHTTAESWYSRSCCGRWRIRRCCPDKARPFFVINRECGRLAGVTWLRGKAVYLLPEKRHMIVLFSGRMPGLQQKGAL